MTERKPPDIDFETWVDKQIREAAERGAFDDLPGSGKPLPNLDKPHGEMWWIKQKVQEEELSTEALLPTPLQLRKEIERLPEEVADLPREQDVRELVADLNRRIAAWLRNPSGPRVHLSPVRVEDVVAQWRAARSAPRPATPREATSPAEPVPRRGWWARLTRRGRTR